MAAQGHTAGGSALTDLILEIFRLNGRLLTAGDQLVEDLGLTSARWQVLGAIAYAENSLPVAWLARSMGLNRQGVQRLVNEMYDDGLVAFEPNPNHKRAHLVVMTRKGHDVYAAATSRQVPWVNSLAKGLSSAEIKAAVELARLVRHRLEKAQGSEP